MIKIENKEIRIEGNGASIVIELAILMREIRNNVDEDAVDLAMHLSKTEAIDKPCENVFKNPLRS